MGAITDSSISTLDLINLSKDIAQLNLGYLGISVTILVILGGIFYYFNIKPLKDSLDKQENTVEGLKEKAARLLEQSKTTEEALLSKTKVVTTKLENKISTQDKKIENIMSGIKSFKRDIMELKIYKHAQKNQLGAVIYSIDLLKEDIDNINTCGYRIPDDLVLLKENIHDAILDPGYATDIEEQLKRLKDTKYNMLIDEVRAEIRKK